MTTQLQYKRGTAARWASLNPVLAAGEPGWESDTLRRKTGDGVTAWNALPYVFDKTTADGLYVVPSTLGNYILGTQKGAANGVATLDANTRIPAAQMPSDFTLHVPRWVTGAVYIVGQQIVSPNNDVVAVTVAHTAGASFDPTKFTLGNSANAKGLVARQTLTAATGAIGSAATIVQNIPSFTFLAGRKYRLEWLFEYVGSTSGNFGTYDIQTCSTADTAGATTGLTKAGGSSYQIGGMSGQHGESKGFVSFSVNTTLQVKASANIWNGAGTTTIQASSTNPMYLSIYDEGAQF